MFCVPKPGHDGRVDFAHGDEAGGIKASDRNIFDR